MYGNVDGNRTNQVNERGTNWISRDFSAVSSETLCGDTAVLKFGKMIRYVWYCKYFSFHYHRMHNIFCYLLCIAIFKISVFQISSFDTISILKSKNSFEILFLNINSIFYKSMH